MTQQISLAAQKVEQNIQSDCMFKTLGDLLRATPHQPSLSGLQDIDYPNMLNLAQKIPLISNISTVPLPTEVLEEYMHRQHNCALGIFPELSRAWLSVDSSIFFWAYDNASDVAYYDGLEHAIVAVHLFKPKKNVFKSHIKYLLCLTTSIEITLLGVTCAEDESGFLATVGLIPDPLFKIPTDNVIFSVLAGTNDGRIFLGGNDGCLYEIAYQSEDSWFSKKCRKINHSHSMLSYITPSFLNFSESETIVEIVIDNDRRLLYTRTEKNSLQLFDIGSEDGSIRHVTTKTPSAIVNQASCIARTIENSNFKPIVGIQALTGRESENIHLVAVTQAGVRLYFSACGGERPSSLDLVHVRLPPGFTPVSIMQRPNAVRTVYHRQNTCIMASSQTENKDTLWVLSNDFYVHEDQIMEAFSVNSLGGRVWCIAEELRPNTSYINQEVPTPPLVVTQHFEERRKIVLLTSDGVYIFYKQRPMDQLNLLLSENQSPDAPAIKSFFQSTKLTEACLTSLILASSTHLPHEKQLSDWATVSFFKFGGSPRLLKTNIMSSPMASHLNSSILDQLDIQFSARHDSIYLYLARILRPIWSLRVVNIEINQQNQTILTNSSSVKEISLILKRLNEMKEFLDKNIQSVIDHDKPNKISVRDDINDATILERESLNAIQVLLLRSIEVLNLYRLLYDHQFSVICSNLPAETQSKLTSTSFAELIVSGTDLTTSIASALVRRYLEDHITTDAISRRLHELCPSIFRKEHAIQARAHEMILQSRVIVDKNDRDNTMTEAVALLKKIGVRLDLQAVCDLLHSAGAYRYIVDICLFIAEKRDPLNLASFIQPKVLKPSMDNGEERDRAAAVSYRMDCYSKIIDTLNRLINTEDFNEVFETCAKSQDELFHTKLYEWLCEKNLSEKLLVVESPFVESFLMKKAESESFANNYLDLMWKFYERRGNYLGAAKILYKLATKQSHEYGLQERLEYLSRAKVCVEAIVTPVDFLHELEENMDVARIQIQVHDRLKELPETQATLSAISRLNFTLYDLTELYQNYALKFNMYDCQLAILKCGNHSDQALIEKLWKCIIDDVLETHSMDSPDNQLHILGNKIEKLGRTLMPTERFFPLYFIISNLEFATHSYNNPRWVPQCLIKIGFRPIGLLEPYHKFYKSRDQSTSWPGKSIHVMNVIAMLMEDSWTRSDRPFSVACLDVICDYLLDLYSMTSSDNSAKQLQERFTALQIRMNDLLKST